MSALASLPPMGLAYLSASLVTLLFCVVVSYWLYTRCWEIRGAKTFLAVIASGGFLWQSVVATHVLTSNRTLQTYITMSELGIAMVTATVWTVFVSRYTDKGIHRTRWFQGGILTLVAIYLGLALTNPSHELLYASFQYYHEPFSFAAVERGPAYLFLIAIVYGMVAVSFYLLLAFLSATGRSSPAGMVLLLSGVAFIILLNLLNIFDLTPIAEFKHASYGALPFIFFTTVSVFRFRLLQIEPVARTTLIESLTDPVIVVDEQRQISDYNAQSTELWPEIGTSVGAPIGQTCPSLVEAIDFPEGGEKTVEQVSLPTIDGHRHFSVLLSPVQPHDSGDVMGYAIMLRDITELEESRKELEHQNEQLDRVSTTISHDLRNPLNVADGYADLLHEKLTRLDADVTAELDDLEKITESHDRMETIIEDVLELAREDHDRGELSTMSLQRAATEAWENIDHKQASMTVEQDGTILATRSRVLSILENLFRNAIEHGGQSVHLEVGMDADSARLYVQDDGPGIPPSQADAVFEYGYSGAESGTGVGLAIVERMAESHGWTISVDTDYDDGARFVISDVIVEATEPPADESVDDSTSLSEPMPQSGFRAGKD